MILLDTGPVVALCDATDALHPRAVRDLGRLARRPLATGTPVLVEACALLPYAAQRRRLSRVLADFAVVPYMVDDEAQLWVEVFNWLDRYAEHQPDWADAYLAVASGRAPRVLVWSYDREFTTIWRRLDGTPIPLAVT